MTLLSQSRGDSSVTFDLDDGARLTELVLSGQSLIVPRSLRDPMWWGAFVMAPWTSLLRPSVVPGFSPAGDDAWHGTARRLPWHRVADGAAVELGGPFEGTRVTLGSLLGDDQLTVRLAMHSNGPEVAAAIGWHPWFPRHLRGTEGVLQVPDDTLAQARDDDGVPTGLWAAPSADRWNNGALLTGPASITYPGIGTLTVSSTSPYAILFEHDQGICIEPTTAPAESLGSMVTPTSPMVLEFRVIWKPDTTHA